MGKDIISPFKNKIQDIVEHGMKEKLENQNILSKPPFNSKYSIL